MPERVQESDSAESKVPSAPPLIAQPELENPIASRDLRRAQRHETIGHEGSIGTDSIAAAKEGVEVRLVAESDGQSVDSGDDLIADPTWSESLVAISVLPSEDIAMSAPRFLAHTSAGPEGDLCERGTNNAPCPNPHVALPSTPFTLSSKSAKNSASTTVCPANPAVMKPVFGRPIAEAETRKTRATPSGSEQRPSSGVFSSPRPGAMRSPASSVSKSRSFSAPVQHDSSSQRSGGAPAGIAPLGKLELQSSKGRNAESRPAQSQARTARKAAAVDPAGESPVSAAQLEYEASEESRYLVAEFDQHETREIVAGKWFDKTLRINDDAIAKRVEQVRWYQPKRGTTGRSWNLFIYLDGEEQELTRRKVGAYC